jgi:hypothetical protein
MDFPAAGLNRSVRIKKRSALKQWHNHYSQDDRIMTLAYVLCVSILDYSHSLCNRAEIIS